MNQKQQELYEKLLKKVNEYCLGYAAEDVIAAIDALVDNYEKPKKRITKTKDQLLVENKAYQLMLHQFRYYVESKEYSLEDIVKRLNALEIIKEKLEPYVEKYRDLGYAIACNMIAIGITQEEYELLKEILK